MSYEYFVGFNSESLVDMVSENKEINICYLQ